MIEEKIKSAIRDIPDFPKPGILFKDITPILKDAILCREIVNTFYERMKNIPVDVVVGVESRGFLFGLMIAQRFEVPFVPIRKKGKLPGDTLEESYELEYGSATLEIHKDAILPGQNVIIHDDLLATGGTMAAAGKLVQKLDAKISAYSFLITLEFLNGRSKIESFSKNIINLVHY